MEKLKNVQLKIVPLVRYLLKKNVQNVNTGSVSKNLQAKTDAHNALIIVYLVITMVHANIVKLDLCLMESIVKVFYFYYK